MVNRVDGVFPPPWPLPNVWIGVSVEDQATADERIPKLLSLPAAVRFISFEPALGPVDFWPFFSDIDRYGDPSGPADPMPDWVIIGGESGRGARPCDIGWLRQAIAQCEEAGVPVFMKQTGSRPMQGTEKYEVTGKGGNPLEWPEDLRIRQWPGEA